MKVYVLTLQEGEYSDWSKWNVGVFASMDDLEAAKRARLQQATSSWDAECRAKYSENDFGVEEWEIGVPEEFEDSSELECPHLDCWRPVPPTQATIDRLERRLKEHREWDEGYGTEEGKDQTKGASMYEDYKNDSMRRAAVLEVALERVKAAMA